MDDKRILLKDSLSELNNLAAIKKINEACLMKLKQAKGQYVMLLQAGSESLAIDSKNSMLETIRQSHLDVAQVKRELFEELIQSELYKKKLTFMVNGSGISEDFDVIFAKTGVIRGYLTIWQHEEPHITSDVTTLAAFIDCQPSSFTVYFANEFDLNKEPQLGRVLFKIKADGVLQKIRGNYDTSD